MILSLYFNNLSDDALAALIVFNGCFNPTKMTAILNPLLKVSILIFGIWLFALTSFARDTNKVFTVGVEDLPFLPFSDCKKGEYTWVFKDALMRFSKEQGIRLKFVPLPLNRLYASFYG